MWENDLMTNPPPFPAAGGGKFVEELKTWKILTPCWDHTLQGKEDELDLRKGFRIERNTFPDPEGLLVSIYDHLERFRESLHLSGSEIPIEVRQCDGFSSESFRLNVGENKITVETTFPEGARRGLYYLEELLTSSKAPFLKKGSIRHDYWLKNRISRCFFGPIKRAPFHIDELMNDVDYYPEPYLDRLAQEGINGLWLTVKFREICSTSFLPEDPHAERRREKLRRTVEKCRKYGIKIWVFAIEPMSWRENNPKPEKLPEGPECWGPGSLFCPDSEEAQKYLYECTNSLFREVPHLGGMLLISLGEFPTSCISDCAYDKEFQQKCQEKCHLTASGIFAKILHPMQQGIKDAGSDGEIISWLYQPQPAQVHPWVYTLPEQLSKELILAYNFESGCTKSQLGKVRAGGDYWLSATGPSDRFGRMAEAVRNKCSLAAKLQVGCSHEVATIPFVPAPGLLYKKYKEMRNCGVSHVIQCWYFGNYPGIMNRAAGALAYEDFSTSESEFLHRLAAPEWGKYAPEMAKVWEMLTKAYMMYPLGCEFQYYGPMHDGVVWPLHLQSILRKMPRTWLPDQEAAGDAVGEFLNNFDLAEISVLTRKMADAWEEAWNFMQSFAGKFRKDKERELDMTLIEALNCHFKAGADIVEFYFRRNRMLNGMGDHKRTVRELEEIVRRQICISERMIELCRTDSRLGYHSEAEVYKYFPEKLQWRCETLQKLLKEDFPMLRQALASGKSPSEVLEKEVPCETGVFYEGEEISWKAEYSTHFLQIFLQVKKRNEKVLEDTLVVFAGDRLASQRPWNTYINLLKGTVSDAGHRMCAEGNVKEEETYRQITLKLPLALFADADCCRIGFEHIWQTQDGKRHYSNIPKGEYDHSIRLQFGSYSPDRMLKLVFRRLS